jgi:hypothetical protein
MGKLKHLGFRHSATRMWQVDVRQHFSASLGNCYCYHAPVSVVLNSFCKPGNAKFLYQSADIAAPVEHTVFDIQHGETLGVASVQDSKYVVLRGSKSVGSQNSCYPAIKPAGCK